MSDIYRVEGSPVDKFGDEKYWDEFTTDDFQEALDGFNRCTPLCPSIHADLSYPFVWPDKNVLPMKVKISFCNTLYSDNNEIYEAYRNGVGVIREKIITPLMTNYQGPI